MGGAIEHTPIGQAVIGASTGDAQKLGTAVVDLSIGRDNRIQKQIETELQPKLDALAKEQSQIQSDISRTNYSSDVLAEDLRIQKEANQKNASALNRLRQQENSLQPTVNTAQKVAGVGEFKLGGVSSKPSNSAIPETNTVSKTVNTGNIQSASQFKMPNTSQIQIGDQQLRLGGS